ncbi:molecular chaperone DnaK [Candidatus Methanomarinus sp.]|nr:molecular chaperone DnaK [ANME-2 cluster archaeon]
MNRNILGIDFGTTNSKMAYMLLDEPEMILNSQGNKITPSIVYFKSEKEAIVGEIAKRNIILEPNKTVSSIKRKMGTDYKKKIGRYKFPPEYIAAEILKKLADDANKQLSKKFTNAVVSVPANYSDSQRQSIKDAAEIAGLTVLRMINEPTAAALAYGIKEDRDRRILVYDFGGGTFDVTILSVLSGFFDVDSTAGAHKLGGDDIDARIVKEVNNKLYEDFGIDMEKDLALRSTILEASEEAKIALSSVETTSINIPFIAADKPPFSMQLTRKMLNSMMSDLIECTKKPIERALDDASLEKNEIDDILLVGGTTLIPAVHEFVTQLFGKEPVKGPDPYEAVALGAAIASLEFGKEKSRMAKNIEISDVISSSLGVLTADGTVSRILERNTKIPIARTRNYTNSWDFVEEVTIPVFQGEGEYPEENEPLGEFWISIEPMLADENKIDVSFEVGKEFGILHVTAIDKISGNERTVKMEARSRLSKKDKNKWMKKLLGVESSKVNIINKSTRDVLNLYLNPFQTVCDLKNELIEKAVMDKNEMLFHNDIELEDAMNISNIDITNNSTIEIRQRNE